MKLARVYKLTNTTETLLEKLHMSGLHSTINVQVS